MGFRVGLYGFRFGEFMKRKLRDSLSLLLPPSRRLSLSLLLSPPLLLSPSLTLAPSLIHVAGHIPCCCATARRPLENARGPPLPRQSVEGGKSIQKRVRTRFPLLKTTALRGKFTFGDPFKNSGVARCVLHGGLYRDAHERGTPLENATGPPSLCLVHDGLYVGI